jgi:high-affinity Fe2+/Pb2+ permease
MKNFRKGYLIGMFPSFLLSLREGLEAALIISIIFGALHKLRREDFKSDV